VLVVAGRREDPADSRQLPAGNVNEKVAGSADEGSLYWLKYGRMASPTASPFFSKNAGA
jgi:hypothetical protein